MSDHRPAGPVADPEETVPDPSSVTPDAEPADETDSAPGPSPERTRWLTSPTGLSAIAAVVGCLIALVSLILTNVVDLRPTGVAALPPTASTAPATGLVTNQLFVYGSSKPGQPRYDTIAHYVKDAYDDAVTGYLYDSNLDYPAAKFGAGDTINGTVLIIHEESEQEFFAEMTRVEGGLFALKQVRTIKSQQLVRAFEWIGPTDGLERIDHWPR